jgi:hypothetical protein
MDALKLILLFIGLALATPIDNPLLTKNTPEQFLKPPTDSITGQKDMHQ